MSKQKYIYIYIYILRAAPHSQTKWPFGHLKLDGQMAIKRKRKRNKK
jgi:hypothetical protein